MILAQVIRFYETQILIRKAADAMVMLQRKNLRPREVMRLLSSQSKSVG